MHPIIVSLFFAGAASVGFERDVIASDVAPVTKLEPFVVEDSKAGAYYLRLLPGEILRVWISTLDYTTERPMRLIPELVRATKVEGHMTSLRSFDLKDGDEVMSVGGRLVAEMTRDEVLRALLSRFNSQPVVVEVRALGSRAVRPARFVLHSAVRSGARVPRS